MERKPVLPPATSSLASLAPLAGTADLRGWLHQVASEVDQLRGRVAHIEEEFKSVSEQGSANKEKLVELEKELDEAKSALATYSETLGKIMAAQANFETRTIAELKAIKNTVVGSSLELTAQTTHMATKKWQAWGVAIGAVGAALLNALLDWIAKQ